MDQVSEVLQTVLKLRELVGIVILIGMVLGIEDMEVAEDGMMIDVMIEDMAEIVMNLMEIEIEVTEEGLGLGLLQGDELVAGIDMVLDEIDLEALLGIDEIPGMIEGRHHRLGLEGLMVEEEIPEIEDRDLGVPIEGDKRENVGWEGSPPFLLKKLRYLESMFNKKCKKINNLASRKINKL